MVIRNNVLNILLLLVVIFYFFNSQREIKKIKSQIEYYRSAIKTMEIHIAKLKEDIEARNDLLNNIDEKIKTNSIIIRNLNDKQLDSLISIYLR